MEIDHQSQRDFEQFHVAEQLRFVDCLDVLNSLYFDEQATVNQQIEAELLDSTKLLVPDRYVVLILYVMISQSQFHHQAPFVDRLQQSWPLVLVDFNRRTDDVVSNLRGLREQRMQDSILLETEETEVTERITPLSQLTPVPSIFGCIFHARPRVLR